MYLQECSFGKPLALLALFICNGYGNKTMKIYVAGVDSSNPEQWSMWDEYALILAENIKQVESLTSFRPIHEIESDKPMILANIFSPDDFMGADL